MLYVKNWLARWMSCDFCDVLETEKVFFRMNRRILSKILDIIANSICTQTSKHENNEGNIIVFVHHIKIRFEICRGTNDIIIYVRN